MLLRRNGRSGKTFAPQRCATAMSQRERPHLLPQLSPDRGVELEEQALPTFVACARLSEVVHPLILRVIVHHQFVHQPHHCNSKETKHKT